jgi:hypothetical protein
MFEISRLRRKVGPKKEKVTEHWKKLQQGVSNQGG